MGIKKLLLALSAFSFLVAGCQSSQPIKQLSAENSGFMILWETYSHCQSSTDFEELQHDAAILSLAAPKSLSRDPFILPLLGKLNQFVAAPSTRLAVDIKAMSAACSLRTAQAAIEDQRIDLARDLLHSILVYHHQSDYAFYSVQAKSILSELEPTSLQVSLNPR